ncbi:MAG: hypothetical protein WD225_08415 [Ilumatobacteraceae bacterium]
MKRPATLAAVPAALLLAIASVACGADDGSSSEQRSPEVEPTLTTDTGESGAGESGTGQRFPDIVDATAMTDGDGTWSFTVTVSSPYDTPERYADGWRVLGPDDTVLGEHTLLHDHASEQPFTRTQRGVQVPDDVEVVTIEGRDQEHGYGGGTVTVDLADVRSAERRSQRQNASG